MSLILKNNSDNNIDVNDLGFTVLSNNTYDLTTQPVTNIRRSNDLLMLVSGGHLVLNDVGIWWTFSS